MRAFHTRPEDRDQTLAAMVKRCLGVSWAQARALIARRQVYVNGQVCTDAVRRLRAGLRLEIADDEVTPKVERKRPVAVRPTGGGLAKKGACPLYPVVVYMDEHILVVDKPAGLTTMRHADEAEEFGARGKRFLPDTLQDKLPALTGERTRFHAVHRIDKETSGLVIFARTPEAEKRLSKQFRAHTAIRTYLALVRGRPTAERIESVILRDRGDGRRGSGEGDGQRAVTHVRVVEELGPFALVECRLETGRTHQVRIHLGEHGAPLCGEDVYDRPVHGRPAPDGSGAMRVMLHAATLGVEHPETGTTMHWSAPLPDDMQSLLHSLKTNARSFDEQQKGGGAQKEPEAERRGDNDNSQP